MTSEAITYKIVRERIKDSASDLLKELAPFPEKDSQWSAYVDNLEAAIEEANDHAWQEVDSWDWAIYTYKGFQVYDCLNGQEQREAESLFEELGGYEQAAEQQIGPYEMGCQMAFYWLAEELRGELIEQAEKLLELANEKLDQMEA